MVQDGKLGQGQIRNCKKGQKFHTKQHMDAHEVQKHSSENELEFEYIIFECLYKAERICCSHSNEQGNKISKYFHNLIQFFGHNLLEIIWVVYLISAAFFNWV